MKLSSSKKKSPNLHDRILDQLIDNINEGLLPAENRRPGYPQDNRFYRQFVGLNRKQLYYKIFNNFRYKKGEPAGIRLSFLGNELLKRNFQFFEFSHSVNPTPRMYLKLDQHMAWPYYFTKRKFVLFHQDDAAWFKLNSSDIGAFKEVI